MISRPLLYSFRRCPYAIRARLALVESGVEVELREVLLKDKPEAMLKLSSKGTVPVLLTPPPQLKVIDESLDIMVWCLKEVNSSWLDGPLSLSEQIHFVDDFERRFKPLLDNYKYHTADKEFTQEQYRTEGLAILNELNLRLAGKAHLCGREPRLVDAAVLPFVRQFANVDPLWFASQELGALREWLSYWLDCNQFKLAMRKYARWTEGEDSSLFTATGE